MSKAGQVFLHFTSRKDAGLIKRSGKLWSSSYVEGVYAIEEGGAYIPGVQQGSLGRTKVRDTAVVFTTRVPPNQRYSEETIWYADSIPVRVLEVLPVDRAVSKYLYVPGSDSKLYTKMEEAARKLQEDPAITRKAKSLLGVDCKVFLDIPAELRGGKVRVVLYLMMSPGADPNIPSERDLGRILQEALEAQGLSVQVTPEDFSLEDRTGPDSLYNDTLMTAFFLVEEPSGSRKGTSHQRELAVRVASLWSHRERLAGAPARARQDMAKKLLSHLLRNANWIPSAFSDGLEAIVPAQQLLSLPEWPANTPARLRVQVSTRLQTSSYSASRIRLKVREEPTEENIYLLLGTPRVRSSLLHELVHYVDDMAQRLNLSKDYDSSNRDTYFNEAGEISAYVGQLAGSVGSTSMRRLRKALRGVRSGKPLHTVLWEVPELSGWGSEYFTELLDVSSITDNPLRNGDYFNKLDVSHLKLLGKHLKPKERRTFLRDLYLSLERIRRRELIPEVAKFLKSRPEVLEVEEDEEYSWKPSGPKTAKAWWAWLLKQA